jgi:hypothetical protein
VNAGDGQAASASHTRGLSRSGMIRAESRLTIVIAILLLILASLSAHGQAAGRVYTPMGVEEKLRYDLRHAVQMSDFLQTAFGAGIGHWRDSPYEWEGNAVGYGRRYTSRFAQHLVKRAIVSGVHVIAREDPRRIPSERTGFRNRLIDSLKYTFVARRDDGSAGLSYSRVVGAYGAALISRRWHPPRVHTFGDGMLAGTVSLGVDAGTSALNAFLPDILRVLRVRRHR